MEKTCRDVEKHCDGCRRMVTEEIRARRVILVFPTRWGLKCLAQQLHLQGTRAAGEVSEFYTANRNAVRRREARISAEEEARG